MFSGGPPELLTPKPSPSARTGVHGATAASQRCSPHADRAQHGAAGRAACRLTLVAGCLHSGCALAQLHP